MLRVVLTGEYGKVFLDPVKHAVGQESVVDLWLPSEGAERMVEIAREAEVIVASAEWVLHEKRTLVKRTLQNAEKLKLILVPFSGMDWLDRAWLPAGSVVCNTNVGIDPIAEYVMLAMLQSAIPLREMDSELRADRWGWGGASVLGRKHHELQGRTIGLVGYGRIGRRVAELSKAFRMRVIAVSRNPGIDHSLEWYKGTDSLDDLLAQSDYVLLSVPGGPETQGLIGAAQLACMKADAVLINIARGSVVDEDALYEALREKRIRGAVIDTWYRYPEAGEKICPPATRPFADLDNVVMTPHAAGWTEELEARRISAIVANVTRFMSGDALFDIYLRA